MEKFASNISTNSNNAKETEAISKEADSGKNLIAKYAEKSVDANKTIISKISFVHDIAFQTFF